MPQRFPLPVPLTFICDDIAGLAGLRWEETDVSICQDNAPTSPVEQLDPFFESLGSWNPRTKTIMVYQNRCRRYASSMGSSILAVLRATALHHIAHAVIELGVHPVTGNKHLAPGNPAKSVANENPSRGLNHSFYDRLIRDEECFAQVFAFAYLLANNDSEELRVFNRLSQGHAGIYSLAPEPPVHPLLRRNWRTEIEADTDKAMADASMILGHLTRGCPL
jgi:hypothetical protein